MVRELPAYEPPHLPLHTTSTDTLAKLTTATKIPTYLTDALALLTAAACDAHETHTATSPAHPDLSTLLEKLDASARSIADATSTHTLTNTTLTPLIALEKQRARRVRDDADSEDEDAANIDSFDTVPVEDSLWARYSTGHDAACEQYTALPNAEKYADGESPYYEYRNTIWGLQHADDGAPLPSARAWFAGQGADDEGEAGEESDDELAVAQEKRSFRCPLSMREFTHPMKSTLCPHTFDKDSIEGYLMVRGRPTAEKDCPMPGCEQMLSMRVMKEDLGLLRVMKRHKEKERERREREVLDRESGDEEEEEAEEWRAAGTRVKGEEGVAVKKEKVLKRKGRERTVNVSDDDDESE